jgi:hypothetical protein
MHAVLKVSPDGRYWVFAYGSQLKVLDAHSNTFVVLPELEQTASAADLEAATNKAAGQPERKKNKKTGRLDPKQIKPTLNVTRTVDFDSTSSLFLSASDDKAITIRKVGSWEVVGRVDKSFVGKKAANGLFSSDTSVLIADKMGDVNLFAVPALDAEEEVLGHFALVTHMLMATLKKQGADGKAQRVLVSADADGRVRVSNFPELFDIKAFCLGHSGVVGDMCLVQSKGDAAPMLATGGEACELFLWDVGTGKQLAKTTVKQHVRLAVDQKCMKDQEVPFDAFVSLVQHDAARNTLFVAVQPFCGLLTFAIEHNALKHVETVALGGVPLAVVPTANGVMVWTSDAVTPMQDLMYSNSVLVLTNAGERVHAINAELVNGIDRAVVSHAMDYALRKRSRIAKQAHSTEAMEENKRKVKARLGNSEVVEEEDDDEEEEEA